MQNYKLTASTENLTEVLTYVETMLEENDCPMKTQVQITVAVEEIFVNIAHYAYETEGGGEAEISMDVTGDPKCFSIRFADWGTPYNPLAKEDPDVTLGLEERQIGGLGIYMVKKSMDNVEYEHTDGKNILTLYKYI